MAGHDLGALGLVGVMNWSWGKNFWFGLEGRPGKAGGRNFSALPAGIGQGIEGRGFVPAGSRAPPY